MSQIDPFDEYGDLDPSTPPDAYKEPSTWHPFLRVLTHQGTVVSDAPDASCGALG